MSRLTAFGLALLFIADCEVLRAEEPTQAEQLFALKVKPLFAEKCFACHGDKPDDIKGDLNMLTREGLLRGGESGEPSLVPGKPKESWLYKAALWEEIEMPPKENDRLSAEQIAVLKDWITAGAPWPNEATQKQIHENWSSAGSDTGVIIKTSGGLSGDWTNRRYDPEDVWALMPIKRPALPIPDVDLSRINPIDVFVGVKLAETGLMPAKRADRRTLIRRITFNLTGLPPTTEDVNAFVGDDNDNSYGELVDRLLETRHYGERMAQHWLDVVRYADTSGFANDWERPNAWRYRDYVIRCFNRDTPFDQFILEQIAGDELRPEDPEMAVATSFLRMGPWEHTAMSVAAVTRQLWLDDVTNSVGETFVGHALRCAKCHDHKFDPIPTRDYYRIQAAFAATHFDDKKDAPITADENVSDAERRIEIYRRQLDPSGLQPITKLKGDNAFSRITKKLQSYRDLAVKRFKPLAFSVKNANPERVAILIGGALERPGDVVDPGVMSCLPKSAEHTIPKSSSGRRLALARFIADSENPLTARVIVNRVWQWHFGRGLVATPNNFGKMGAKPSHPELHDWLSSWFIDNGWSIKKLNRLIVTSKTFQRGSTPPDSKRVAELDPNNELLSYVAPRRLSAEELRDAMLAVTNELSTVAGGPGVFPEINWEVALQPRHIMGSIAPSYRPSLRAADRNRRTIYAFRYRGLSDPMLEVFNKPNPDLSCERRDQTTVTPQAFELFNGQFAHNRALALADRVASEAGDPRGQVERVFQLAFARQPSDAEMAVANAHVKKMIDHHRANPPQQETLPTSVERQMIAEETGVLFRWREKLFLDGYERDLQPSDVSAQTRALAELCLVLLNSSEFLYVY